MEYEDTIERQRRQLSMLNISLNDRELGNDPQRSHSKKKSAKELIAQEEEEIRRLEAELNEKSRGLI